MQDLARSTLDSVVWLVTDTEGQVAATSATGTRLTGTLSPPLDEIRLAQAGGPGPVPARWTDTGGRTSQLMVLPMPGLDGAVGLPVAALEAHVGRAVEDLVNQVAHDIRNFAFAMGLQAELGERRAATPDVRGHFAAVLRQIDGLKRYLERLLLYGRPARLELGTIDLDHMVREAVRRLQFSRDPAAAPVSVALEIDATGDGLRWDGAAIGKALDALLDNAARSAEPPPHIRIVAAEDDDAVTLWVIDRGPGIPPERLARLSVPMVVRRPGAAGLGLAIARKIIAAHGGELGIESTADGTTVTLRIPREANTG